MKPRYIVFLWTKEQQDRAKYLAFFYPETFQVDFKRFPYRLFVPRNSNVGYWVKTGKR